MVEGGLLLSFFLFKIAPTLWPSVYTGPDTCFYFEFIRVGRFPGILKTINKVIKI
jgi:hypothetical protein